MKPYPRRENTYFQNIDISKFIFQALVTPIPNYIVTEVEKKLRKLFMGEFNPKD